MRASRKRIKEDRILLQQVRFKWIAAMSKKHPVVVVTGSSGAGTSTVRKALESIFHRRKIKPVIIEGDSFHRYDRETMRQKMEQASHAGLNFSHFGEQANQFDKLEHAFRSYGETGSGRKRFYLHNADEARLHGERLGVELKSGQFTPWEDIESDTDLLFYEGLHGLVKTEAVDMTRYADLKVGVVPVVNL
jgi:phosphoribulokinase